MIVGFIGLGNVGGKLAGTLQRNGVDLIVRDLSDELVAPFVARGARFAPSPAEMARTADIVVTCLPSPAACAHVVEGPDGLLEGMEPGKIWAEMSTTDEAEVRRLGALVRERGAEAADCPVSGGCHRAATGNIAIFAGCERPVFERLLPLLTIMGRQILHTGELGSASILKVVTNYLATANLVSVCEALATSHMAGMDLGVAYEAIRVSSGNSFVHETEGQLILNGSRDIGFTMDLVKKDVGLFQAIADRAGLPLELSPLLVRIFDEGIARYGDRELSTNIVKRLEEACGSEFLAPGFPAELVDDEPEVRGAEVRVGER